MSHFSATWNAYGLCRFSLFLLWLQGLPAFLFSLSGTSYGKHDCHFGTLCFQNVTKVKSRAVLRVLRAGYHVLLSDADVYWFADVRGAMMGFGPGVMAAQSDNHVDDGERGGSEG